MAQVLNASCARDSHKATVCADQDLRPTELSYSVFYRRPSDVCCASAIILQPHSSSSIHPISIFIFIFIIHLQPLHILNYARSPSPTPPSKPTSVNAPSPASRSWATEKDRKRKRTVLDSSIRESGGLTKGLSISLHNLLLPTPASLPSKAQNHTQSTRASLFSTESSPAPARFLSKNSPVYIIRTIQESYFPDSAQTHLLAPQRLT